MLRGCSCNFSFSHYGSCADFNDQIRCSSSKIPDRPPNPKAFVGFKKSQPYISKNRVVDSSGSKQIQDIQRGIEHVLLRDSKSCSNLPTLVSKHCSFSNKAKRYGGALPSILRAMNRENDLEKILNSSCRNLSPKEQTVVLKEQRRWENVVRVFEFFKTGEDYEPNVIHYNIVLRSLGRARQWDKLESFWIEMGKKGVLPTNDTYGTLVDVYGKAGRFKASLSWIKHMKVHGLFPDEVTMNTVVKVMKDAGEYDRGEKFFKGWCYGNIELDFFGFNSADTGFDSLTHFPDDADESLPLTFSEKFDSERHSRRPRRTSTYNSLIDLYGKAGRVKEASEVFDEMMKSKIAMDTITYNTMMHTFGSHGHLADAEALLEKMEEQGVAPDTQTYNILLSLYANAGDIDAASMWYRKIREVGLFPDFVTYRALLHILCERKMVEKAAAVMQDMQRASHRIDEHSVPGIVKMYIGEGLLTEAANLLAEIDTGGEFSSKTRAAILDAYAEKGFWFEAESIFKRLKNFNGKNDVLEYNVMIKAYGMAKLDDAAYDVFRSMRSCGVLPDACTFNSLVQMFSNAGKVDLASEMLDEMQREGFTPQCATFSSLIAGYARRGQLPDAVHVFEEMTERGVEPNEVVFGALINGYAENGECKEALKYVRIMEKREIPLNQIVLTSLVKVYSKLCCLSEARNVYQKLENLEGGPDVIASNTMLSFYAELELIGEAEILFRELKQKQTADGFSYSTMIRLYKKMGMLAGAVNVAKEMKAAELPKDLVLYNNMMSCYVADGHLLDCGELLHEMISERISPDERTLKILFTLLKKGGVSLDAITQMECCYGEGKPGAGEAVFATVFSAVGLRDLALKWCERLVNSNAALDLFVVNTAINIYGVCGEVHKAFNMFLKLQDEGFEPDIVTYTFLAYCYGKAGMIEGVKRVYWLVLDGEIAPSESLLRAVADAFKMTMRSDLANLVTQAMKCLTADSDCAE